MINPILEQQRLGWILDELTRHLGADDLFKIKHVTDALKECCTVPVAVVVSSKVKLWRVRLRGMQSCATGTHYGNCYALATDPTAAADKVIAYVNDRDVGFTGERVLESVELVAETGDYPGCRTQIHL